MYYPILQKQVALVPPPLKEGGPSTCLNNRKKSDENVFTTFLFHYQHDQQTLEKFSDKFLIVRVHKMSFFSTHSFCWLYLSFLMFLPILQFWHCFFFAKIHAKKTATQKKLPQFTPKIFQNSLFLPKKNLQKSTERCQKPKRIVGKNQKNIGSSQVFVKYSQKQTSNFSFFFKRWITARIVSSWKPHLARCKMMSLEKLLPFSKTYCITTATKSDYP